MWFCFWNFLLAFPTCEPLVQFACANGRCVSAKWHCDSGEFLRSVHLQMLIIYLAEHMHHYIYRIQMFKWRDTASAAFLAASVLWAGEEGRAPQTLHHLVCVWGQECSCNTCVIDVGMARVLGQQSSYCVNANKMGLHSPIFKLRYSKIPVIFGVLISGVHLDGLLVIGVPGIHSVLVWQAKKNWHMVFKTDVCWEDIKHVR